MELDHNKIEEDLEQLKNNLAYIDMVLRMKDTLGEPLFENASAEDIELLTFRSELKSHTGVLQTANGKRNSQSTTLILQGSIVDCRYLRPPEILKEKLWIRWKAVERDLDNNNTSVSFHKIDERIVSSASAFFRGTHQLSLLDISIQMQVEELIRLERASHSESGIIISLADCIAFYTFLAHGELIGNLAAIRTANGYKFGYQPDLSLLCFESQKDPEARSNLYTLSKRQKQDLFENCGL